jgi:hypothetical protein
MIVLVKPVPTLPFGNKGAYIFVIFLILTDDLESLRERERERERCKIKNLIASRYWTVVTDVPEEAH